MRVKELAELAGTTVRTVRHYHHVGLLEVPAAAGGLRDYGLEHLARLLRIRWLVGAGLSLATIRDVLASETRPEPVGGLADLRGTLAAIDEQLDDLRAQRERIVSLIERAESDGSVTPLPSGLSRMYDRVAARLPSARARLALDAERRIVSILAVRGLLPPALDDLISGLTPVDDDTVVELFTAFGDYGIRPFDAARFEGHIKAWVDFTDRHEDQIAAILRQVSGRRAAVFGLVARLIRLAYPSRAHAQVIDRCLTEVKKNPRLMQALNRDQPQPESIRP